MTNCNKKWSCGMVLKIVIMGIVIGFIGFILFLAEKADYKDDPVGNKG